MSQKPFMWNRNNPYQFSDSSGYQTDNQRLEKAAETELFAQAPGMAKGILQRAIDEIKVQDLAARAKALAGGLNGQGSSRSTIAVTQTSNGERIVTSSEAGRLRPQVRNALSASETGQTSGTAGVHAEIKGLEIAYKNGLVPVAVGANRPVCSDCQGVLNALHIPYSP